MEQMKPNGIDYSYLGYTNYETWQVALCIANDEQLYNIARKSDSYVSFAKAARALGILETGNGIRWFSRKVNKAELDQVLSELG